MKIEEFNILMERNGLQVQDKLAFGNIKGYPVLVRKESGNKVKLCFYLEDNPWQDIRTEVLALAKEYKVDVYFENGQVVWNTRLKAEEDEKLQNMWNGITLIFQDKGIKTPKRCVLCGACVTRLRSTMSNRLYSSRNRINVEQQATMPWPLFRTWACFP